MIGLNSHQIPTQLNILERFVTQHSPPPTSEPQLCYDALWEIRSCAACFSVREQSQQQQQQLKQECLHVYSRLDAAQSECQREREVRDTEREQEGSDCVKKGWDRHDGTDMYDRYLEYLCTTLQVQFTHVLDL